MMYIGIDASHSTSPVAISALWSLYYESKQRVERIPNAAYVARLNWRESLRTNGRRVIKESKTM